MIKIKANYSFWRHPIKWLKDRKKRQMLEFIWNNRSPEEQERMSRLMFVAQRDAVVYGRGFIHLKDLYGNK